VAYVRTVKTASGATAVQIVWSSRRGSRSIEHVGSAHDEAELAALKAAAAQRLAAGQAELDLGLAGVAGSEPLLIMSSRMSHLWDALCAGYEVLGSKRGPPIERRRDPDADMTRKMRTWPTARLLF
jgi:hypothetical protein